MEEDIHKKYSVETKPVKSKPDCWDTLEVTLFQAEKDEKKQIGSYQRNYPELYNTFVPFTQNGKDYALYSPEYTGTRILELPSCKDIGGEEPTSEGFCPVDFFVPIYRKARCRFKLLKDGEEKEYDEEVWLTEDECFDEKKHKGLCEISPVMSCDFGFVAGCVWGDDTSWKIQYLDLSKASEGILKRDERFGYIHLSRKMMLKDAIDLNLWEPEHPLIKIAHATSWNLKTNEKYDDI